MKLQEGTHTNSCRNSGVNSIVPTRRRSNNTQTQYVDFVGPPLSQSHCVVCSDCHVTSFSQLDFSRLFSTFSMKTSLNLLSKKWREKKMNREEKINKEEDICRLHDQLLAQILLQHTRTFLSPSWTFALNQLSL